MHLIIAGVIVTVIGGVILTVVNRKLNRWLDKQEATDKAENQVQKETNI